MKWTIPSLEEELGEFERVAKTLLVPLSRLIVLFQAGTMQELDDSTWSKLENTDSWDTTSLEKVSEALHQKGRDPRCIKFSEVIPMKDNAFQAPIIIEFFGRAHLVSGNTRLMFSRAAGHRPQVYKLKL